MKTEEKISVRRATLRDAEEILRCLKEAFTPYKDNYTPGAFADTVLTELTLRRRFAEMRILVASDEFGRVLGTIAYRTENAKGHLRGMAVLPFIAPRVIRCAHDFISFQRDRIVLRILAEEAI